MGRYFKYLNHTGFAKPSFGGKLHVQRRKHDGVSELFGDAIKVSPKLEPFVSQMVYINHNEIRKDGQ